MSPTRSPHHQDDAPSSRTGLARGWLIAAVAAVVLVGAGVAVTKIGSGPSGSGNPTTTAPSVTPSSDTTSSTQPSTGLALGQVSDPVATTDAGKCPSASCLQVTVACPGIPDATAVLAIQPASGTARGLVAFFSGGTGRAYWATTGNKADDQALASVADAGMEAVMVRWVTGWADLPRGDATGFAVAACRPASVVKWLHDGEYAQMGVTPDPGTCGFCITGNSGGSSQVAYSLTHYGLAPIVDAAVLTSGPPHAALAKGCLRNPGEEAYWYDPGNDTEIDGVYGFTRAAGPCSQHDASMVDQWNRDSVDLGGTAYSYATTRVEIIIGANDKTVAPAHAHDFFTALQAAGSPWISEVTAVGMAHGITSSPDGRKQLLDALLGAP